MCWSAWSFPVGGIHFEVIQSWQEPCLWSQRETMCSISPSLNKQYISVSIRDSLVSQREKEERLRLRLPFVNFKSLIWKQDDNSDLWSLLGWMVCMFNIEPFCCLSLELWQCSTFCTHVLTEICLSVLKRKISVKSKLLHTH